MTKDFLTIAEAAARLGVSPKRAYQLAAAGTFPTVRRGRSLLVPVVAWERFVEAQTEEALAGMNSGAKNGGSHAQAA